MVAFGSVFNLQGRALSDWSSHPQSEPTHRNLGVTFPVCGFVSTKALDDAGPNRQSPPQPLSVPHPPRSLILISPRRRRDISPDPPTLLHPASVSPTPSQTSAAEICPDPPHTLASRPCMQHNRKPCSHRHIPLPHRFVFTHLSEPSDKLQMLLQMLHKLYALVSTGVAAAGAAAAGAAAAGVATQLQGWRLSRANTGSRASVPLLSDMHSPCLGSLPTSQGFVGLFG